MLHYCCTLSRAVVVPAAVAATTEPSAAIAGRCQYRGHRHCFCRRKCIRCSLHRHPHPAAAFTAIVDAAVTAAATAALPTQFSSTQPSRAIAIAVAVAVAVAFAITVTVATAGPVTVASPSPSLLP